MNPDELLRGLPGYPYTGWALVVLALAAGAAKSWQNRPQKQRTTNANLGRRLQAVEQLQALEVVRRLQVEDVLRGLGVRLPYWPGDPPTTPAHRVEPAPRPPAVVDEHQDDELDDDQDDGYDDRTAARPAIPPLPRYPRHARSAAR